MAHRQVPSCRARFPFNNPKVTERQSCRKQLNDESEERTGVGAGEQEWSTDPFLKCLTEGAVATPWGNPLRREVSVRHRGAGVFFSLLFH